MSPTFSTAMRLGVPAEAVEAAETEAQAAGAEAHVDSACVEAKAAGVEAQVGVSTGKGLQLRIT